MDNTSLCHFRKGTSSSTTIWVSERAKKTELKVMVFCNTVTLALTNKHDTVVGSSPRANHSTLTDGCWDGIKHPAPLPVSLPVFAHSLLLFSPAHMILYCSTPQFPPSRCCEYPFLIFSSCFSPSYNSVSTFLLFFLSPLTCPFALHFTPSVNTSSSSSGQWFDKKVEEQARKRECARPHSI